MHTCNLTRGESSPTVRFMVFKSYPDKLQLHYHETVPGLTFKSAFVIFTVGGSLMAIARSLQILCNLKWILIIKHSSETTLQEVFFFWHGKNVFLGGGGSCLKHVQPFRH